MDIVKTGTDILGAIKAGENYLKSKGINSPRLESEVLLAYVLKKERIELYLEKDILLSNEQIKALEEMLHKRGEGVPTSYLIGSREFLSMDFITAPGVLIPRPETELLVEEVLSLLDKTYFGESFKEHINIIDIGTGCGIIAVSIAKFIPACHVYAVDISKKALEIAGFNAVKFNVENKITFIEGELLSCIQNYGLAGKTHVIVSNPPYIPTDEIITLQKEIKDYEPITALDGGRDGLDYYREIVPSSTKYLVKGGILALEVGYNQAQAVKILIEETNSFYSITIKKDYAGHERIVTAIRK